MNNEPITDLLERAIAARESLFDPQHQAAFRLFNGFYEGFPSLVVDLFARTVVLQNYAGPPAEGDAAVASAQRVVRACFPWIQAVILKTRHGLTQDAKQGKVIYGESVARRVQEHGVWYAIDLMMNQDTSLYLDTRNLRKWAIENLRDKTVLNTFAYTGSLGVAARAGGAARVLHLDRNRRFLNLAKASYSLNGFPVARADFQAGDFWPQASRLKRSGERFDCVFLDPPFFSSISKGTVDLAKDSARLINKLRPLVNDGGYLAAVNNALFLSGKDYIETLESLCADGYLQIETLIPVPEDFTGYPNTRLGSPPVDPAPFNHATKIAVLRVRHHGPADRRHAHPPRGPLAQSSECLAQRHPGGGDPGRSGQPVRIVGGYLSHDFGRHDHQPPDHPRLEQHQHRHPRPADRAAVQSGTPGLGRESASNLWPGCQCLSDLGGFPDRGCPAAIPLTTGEPIPNPLKDGDVCA